MSPRIALVHALHASIDPAAAAFARGWPSARITNLLDDSLSSDLARSGSPDGDMERRFRALGRYCVSNGAVGLLFTCSAFGRAIARVRDDLDVPVLGPSEAMVEEATEAAREAGGRIVVLATFAPTLGSMREELERVMTARAAVIDVELRFVEGALAALERGQGHEHDQRIADAAIGVSERDVLVLAQFSMARAAPLVRERVAAPLLTSPDSAVARLRSMVAATASPASNVRHSEA